MSQIRHSSEDIFWMRRALGLAQELRGHVWPNPAVGCVIVRDGVAVAEATTQPGGRPHAERKALDAAGDASRGATLYVTLEPCCHWGKTPPCAGAIIAAGVSNVVCAIRDPDPRVNGGGFAKLREAGINVRVGALADDAAALMSGFFHRVNYGVPEMVLVDGELAQPQPGIDALLMSSTTEMRLLAHSGEIELTGLGSHGLLAHLGELGLTSVAIPKDDPLMAALSAELNTILRDRHRDVVGCTS